MLSKLFGAFHRHTPPTGWSGGAPYGRVAYRGTDGLGTGHYAVVLRCTRCGKPFDAVMFHAPKGAPITPN